MWITTDELVQTDEFSGIEAMISVPVETDDLRAHTY